MTKTAKCYLPFGSFPEPPSVWQFHFHLNDVPPLGFYAATKHGGIALVVTSSYWKEVLPVPFGSQSLESTGNADLGACGSWSARGAGCRPQNAINLSLPTSLLMNFKMSLIPQDSRSVNYFSLISAYSGWPPFLQLPIPHRHVRIHPINLSLLSSHDQTLGYWGTCANLLKSLRVHMSHQN